MIERGERPWSLNLRVGIDICESVRSESVRRSRTTHRGFLPALAGVRRTGCCGGRAACMEQLLGAILYLKSSKQDTLATHVDTHPGRGETHEGDLDIWKARSIGRGDGATYATNLSHWHHVTRFMQVEGATAGVAVLLPESW